MNLQDISETARHALSEARKVGVNDPAIIIIDPNNPIALKGARRIAPVPDCPDALVVIWGRKADAVELVEDVVPGSDTAKIAAEQLDHDNPYLLQVLCDKVIRNYLKRVFSADNRP